MVVDVTLVDAMLALTPVERLRANDRMIRTVEALRHGFTVAQGAPLTTFDIDVVHRRDGAKGRLALAVYGRSVVHIIGTYRERWATGMKAGRAKVFWTGRSQAVRLPKEYRFDTDTVSVRREGAAVILEPTNEWPEGYVESFTGVPEEFRRPEQGKVDEREKLA